MSTDNITPIRTSVTKVTMKPITLEMVIASMNDWRLNKKKLNEKIPEKRWDQIFVLITSPEPEVLKVLGVSQGQFIREKLDRESPAISPPEKSSAVTADTSITQVTPSHLVPNSPETALKSPVFPKPTIVTDVVSKDVEFCESNPPLHTH